MHRNRTFFFAICIILFFLFLRIYRIQQSLEFFDDMGRDSLVLYEWKTSGKPPLLGPQTSVLPAHQSALYFYLLFPGFLLTNMSPFHAIWTSIFFYLAYFIAIVALFYKKQYIQQILVLAFLWTIYPQLILQQRFVWNPTFVPLFLSIAFFCIYLLKQHFSQKTNWIFGIATALAVSFSYSVLPTVVVMFFICCILFRTRVFSMLMLFFISFVFINAPTILFEFRHHFSITQSLISRGAEPQHSIQFSTKMTDFFERGITNQHMQFGIVVLVAIVLMILFELRIKQQNMSIKESIQTYPFPYIFFLAFVLTMIAPVPMLSHYLFGVITALFFSIAFLPTKKSMICVCMLFILWVNKATLSPYFQPAMRTVSELESCAKQICAEQKEPLFISVQAGFHPFHRGPEYYFLLKKAGCNVRDIEKEPHSASHMAVFVDNSTYEHGKTAYHELTVFGKSEIQQTNTCSDTLTVHIIQQR